MLKILPVLILTLATVILFKDFHVASRKNSVHTKVEVDIAISGPSLICTPLIQIRTSIFLKFDSTYIH